MHDDNKKKNQFDYGDSVRVKDSAPKKYFPGEPGDICGMDQIIFDEGAEKYTCQKGEWIYTVEYVDGSSVSVPEQYLEPDPDRLIYGFGDKVIMKPNIPYECYPSGIVSVSGYHHISCEDIALKFNLKIGDVIYLLKTGKEEEFLAPESYIEKKYKPIYKNLSH